MGEFRDVWTDEYYECPKCGDVSMQRFIDLVEDELLDEKYGKCRHKNHCGYNVRPELIRFINDDEVCVNSERTPDVINYDLYNIDYDLSHKLNEVHNAYIKYDKDVPPYFLIELIKRFGINAVHTAQNKYHLASFFDNSVMYPYYFKSNLINSKIIWYTDKFHRDKYINPQWLNSVKTYDYYSPFREIKYKCALPLFGWDLLDKPENKNKKVCIVEAEKSAFICSVLMPEFIWLATGGLVGLKAWKFPYNSHREFYLFADMNIKGINYADDWKKDANIIAEQCPPFTHTFIDYMPSELNEFNRLLAYNRGYDIADFIMDAEKLGYDLNTYINYIKLLIENN